MKYILTSEEMKACDAFTIKNYTPSIELMENAGRNCYLIIKERIKKTDKILVVCGAGGNGGDGLVIARHLSNDGYDVTIFLASNHFKEETKTNYLLYKGKEIFNIFNVKNKEFDVIIDALLGVGLTGNLKPNYIEIINKINDIDAYKISVDIPSGIDASTGKCLGTFIKVNDLISIEAYKYGDFFYEGKDAYENLFLAKAGVIIDKNPSYLLTLEDDDVKNLFPKRNKESNKGTYGRVALIGGSKLTPGALILSRNSLTSLRCGVGYTTLCVPSSLYPIYALRYPEIIYKLMSDIDGNMIFDEKSLSSLLNYDAISIGMGIGTSEEVYKIVNYLLKNYHGNLIIDADALNSLSKYGINSLLNHTPKNVILLPHIKEFSRLSGYEVPYIKENMISLGVEFAKKYNVILDLKDYVSFITDGNKKYLNINGNPGLAKGGSGDVLSGLILGLNVKDGNNVLKAAAASYILGKSADLMKKKMSEYSLVSEDIIKGIGEII